MAELRAVLLAAGLMITSCNTTGTTPAMFLRGFEPSGQRIHGYDRAAAVPYTVRVNSADLETVNAVVNAVPYRRDARGEWIAPTDFWRRGGDCEDYAMAKAAELKAAGRRGLWIAVLTDGPHGEAHAVLVVADGDETVALDNRTQRLLPWASVEASYSPVYIIDTLTGEVYRRRTGWSSVPDGTRSR